MREVGLAPSQVDRYPHEFSGGQRQRIGIARALAPSPALVIADEPVSALDVSIQSQILNLLSDLRDRHGLAYLFITHDLAVVSFIADRVAVMYLGHIVETAPRDALFGAPRHPYTQALRAAIPVPGGGKRRRGGALPGDVPSPLAPPARVPVSHPLPEGGRSLPFRAAGARGGGERAGAPGRLPLSVMTRYAAGRLVESLIVILVVSFAVYGLMALMPGDPVDIMVQSDPNLTPEDAQRLKALYGLDKPVVERYGNWLAAAVRGDFGYSRIHNRPVLEVLVPRLVNTTVLLGLALVLSLALAVPIGIASALRPYSAADYGINFVALAGISVPVFWFALMLIILFSVELGWLPAGGMRSVEPRAGPGRGVGSGALPDPAARHPERGEHRRVHPVRARIDDGGAAPRLHPDRARQGRAAPAGRLPPRVAQRDDPGGDHRRPELRDAVLRGARHGNDVLLPRHGEADLRLDHRQRLQHGAGQPAVRYRRGPALQPARGSVLRVARPEGDLPVSAQMPGDIVAHHRRSLARLTFERFLEHRMALASAVVLVGLGACALAAPLVEAWLGHDADEVDLLARFRAFFGRAPLGHRRARPRRASSRLLYGGRVSLLVGLTTTLVAAAIGTVIGLIAGYRGGWMDALLMRLTDTVIALPLLPFLIVLAAVDLGKLGVPPDIAASPDIGLYRIVVIIALFGWTTVARLVRGAALSLRERDFVLAAQSQGASGAWIMVRHILPNAVSPIIGCDHALDRQHHPGWNRS